MHQSKTQYDLKRFAVSNKYVYLKSVRTVKAVERLSVTESVDGDAADGNGEALLCAEALVGRAAKQAWYPH